MIDRPTLLRSYITLVPVFWGEKVYSNFMRVRATPPDSLFVLTAQVIKLVLDLSSKKVKVDYPADDFATKVSKATEGVVHKPCYRLHFFLLNLVQFFYWRLAS